jgi:hypothetical protein
MQLCSFPTCLSCTRASASCRMQAPNLIPRALLYNRTREILNLLPKIPSIRQNRAAISSGHDGLCRREIRGPCIAILGTIHTFSSEI